jgi:hypothetical protein
MAKTRGRLPEVPSRSAARFSKTELAGLFHVRSQRHPGTTCTRASSCDVTRSNDAEARARDYSYPHLMDAPLYLKHIDLDDAALPSRTVFKDRALWQ